MKNLSVVCIIILCVFMSESTIGRRRGRHRAKRVVVVKHSRFRPKRISVFRPAWHPRLTCQRRWVYFPRYNFYWDNWRNRYMVYSGTVWVSQSKAPESATNVNLAEEKYYELEEAEDDNDEIAMANSRHKEK